MTVIELGLPSVTRSVGPAPADGPLLDTHGRDVHRFLIALVGPEAADHCYQETWLAGLRPTVLADGKTLSPHPGSSTDRFLDFHEPAARCDT